MGGGGQVFVDGHFPGEIPLFHADVVGAIGDFQVQPQFCSKANSISLRPPPVEPVAASSPEARLRSTSSVSNFSHYASDTVDDLLDEIAVEDDPQAQKDLMAQIDAELWSDFYGVPLYQYPTVVAFSSTVENVSPSPLSGLLWNVWEWQPPTKAE